MEACGQGGQVGVRVWHFEGTDAARLFLEFECWDVAGEVAFLDGRNLISKLVVSLRLAFLAFGGVLARGHPAVNGVEMRRIFLKGMRARVSLAAVEHEYIK